MVASTANDSHSLAITMPETRVIALTKCISSDRDIPKPQSATATSGAQHECTCSKDNFVIPLLKTFGKALFSVGLPLHVVEYYLALIGTRFGVALTVVSIQTSMWISFSADSTCHLVLADHATLSLSKMVEMSILGDDLTSTEDIENANKRLAHIISRPPLWDQRLMIPAMIMFSALCAPLFNGGWIEMGVAAISAMFIGIVEFKIAPLFQSVNRGHDIIVGLIATLITVVFRHYIAEINVLAAIFAGIVWTLPGLRISLAMTDMSTSNSISGTGKLMSAIFTCLNIGIGIAGGLQFAVYIDGSPIDLFAQVNVPTPTWVLPVCVAMSSIPVLALLDAKPSHAVQLIAIYAIAYTLSSQLTTIVGTAFGIWLAALAVGIIANLYGRWSGYPAIELTLFGIIMLVPGAIGVKSILADDTLDSLTFFSSMIEIAAAIVAGLFTSNIIVPPKRVAL